MTVFQRVGGSPASQGTALRECMEGKGWRLHPDPMSNEQYHTWVAAVVDAPYRGPCFRQAIINDAVNEQERALDFAECLAQASIGNSTNWERVYRRNLCLQGKGYKINMVPASETSNNKYTKCVTDDPSLESTASPLPHSTQTPLESR